MIVKKHRSVSATPKVLDNFWGISLGSNWNTAQSSDAQGTTPPISVTKSPDSGVIDRFTIKHFVTQFLLLFNSRATRPPHSHQENDLAIHAQKINALASSLKIERERIRQLTQELTIARSALMQMNELQAELNVERETGRLLVQFLEDAERKAKRVPVLEELLRKRNNFDDK